MLLDICDNALDMCWQLIKFFFLMLITFWLFESQWYYTTLWISLRMRQNWDISQKYNIWKHNLSSSVHTFFFRWKNCYSQEHLHMLRWALFLFERYQSILSYYSQQYNNQIRIQKCCTKLQNMMKYIECQLDEIWLWMV